MRGPLAPLDGAPDPVCSRAGCQERPTTRVTWRNPRIHAADRRKVWLACDAHVDYLRDFLAARDFPVTTEPFSATAVGG
ncbi:hypothetical protein [Microbacterium sp.]|uniref:hypothetical protein n=1 Tax=Microbacterium sp. TaxID=51671 RepID=UPI00092C7543|nr:hypothetical protein [Microbacterium sp.]MBN9169337.1 hypothetical protein [Microbacterium sp.]MBN9179777.1 hypothetical protein [Microbacterium sp.]MBN9191158.1 hypothetical protein [Microbacterium sp.]OJU62965.1 MAG: hypothetical protein BGO04_09465 [Microbacterium sp. 70-38]